MSLAKEKEAKKLAEKHSRILNDLLKQEGNSVCADCYSQGPRWASWNLGVFLCIRCGSIHRGIGTHITKVKSVTLDKWTPEQIEHFRKIGNVIANNYFCPNAEPRHVTRSDTQLQRYIRDKYERRIFIDRKSSVPDPTLPADSTPGLANSYSSPNSSNISERIKIESLTKLKEMGFSDIKENHAVLKQFNYDAVAASKFLRNKHNPSKSKTFSPNDPKVRQLVGMGFEDVDLIAKALQKCGGDVVASLELLITNSSAPSKGPPSKTTSSPPPLPPKYKPTNSNNVDLLGMDDDFANININTSQQNSNTDNDMFGDFISASSAAPNPAPADNIFSTQPTSNAPTKPDAANKSVFDKDFLLSLYSKPTPTQQHQTADQSTNMYSNTSLSPTSISFQTTNVLSNTSNFSPSTNQQTMSDLSNLQTSSNNFGFAPSPRIPTQPISIQHTQNQQTDNAFSESKPMNPQFIPTKTNTTSAPSTNLASGGFSGGFDDLNPWSQTTQKQNSDKKANTYSDLDLFFN
ncbi:hypothetical protein BB559_006212 [Furculomyces boomerangus]|uniref:Arf-GAP domain-containing protein n=2 Tax=Harpellales TaxID=61421 RepID=A0A2T9Y493_9FUNG|nr:hypothetical protein BB559_006212 [Furculomyces boomerangus]PWA02813.1 hypothetical protein BB558_001039 [Smittium angustum]